MFLTQWCFIGTMITMWRATSTSKWCWTHTVIFVIRYSGEYWQKQLSPVFHCLWCDIRAGLNSSSDGVKLAANDCNIILMWSLSWSACICFLISLLPLINRSTRGMIQILVIAWQDQVHLILDHNLTSTAWKPRIWFNRICLNRRRLSYYDWAQG